MNSQPWFSEPSDYSTSKMHLTYFGIIVDLNEGSGQELNLQLVF